MRRRTPLSKRAWQSLKKILPAVLILVVAIVGGFGFIVYRLTHPGATPETVNPSHFILPALDVSWSSSGDEVAGWLIPGLKGAPGILLSPGYGMSRSDVLSLAAVLRENGFNILIYDQRGCGSNPRGGSSLGLREPDDLLAALDFLQSRPEINRDRLGIWGVDVGARAALVAAATRPEVRAVAADSAFGSVVDFVNIRLREDLHINSSSLEFCTRQFLGLYLLSLPSSMYRGISLEALADRSILFIQGENRRELAGLTAALYDQLRPQKEMITLPVARVRLMGAEELKTYDRQVSNFFRLNLQGAAPSG
jgi:pimeloyl-ACP methyl ester carboxylesterase